MEQREYNVGDKIYFAEEKKPYTIRACDERFLICTKPYNFRPRTVIYTIVDLVEGIRGTDNYSIGPYDYYDTDDCNAVLGELQQWASGVKTEIVDGQEVLVEPLFGTQISHRNRIELNIVKTKQNSNPSVTDELLDN